jgi:phosphoglycolate phosphatase-like HAD superfamily hydrolase
MLELRTAPQNPEGAQHPIEAAIFDLDGTLIDTVEIYFSILYSALERLGLPLVSRAAVLEAAEDGEFNWQGVLPVEKMSRKEETLKDLRAIIDEISPGLFRERATLIPRADHALRILCGAGAKIGLVTSTRRKHLEAKLLPMKRAGVEILLDAVVTADEVFRKKPAPEPLLVCAEKLGVSAVNSIYIGDMRADMMAGRAAGMMTIGVLTGFDDYDRLKKENPDMIIDSVAELPQKLMIGP